MAHQRRSGADWSDSCLRSFARARMRAFRPTRASKGCNWQCICVAIESSMRAHPSDRKSGRLVPWLVATESSACITSSARRWPARYGSSVAPTATASSPAARPPPAAPPRCSDRHPSSMPPFASPVWWFRHRCSITVRKIRGVSASPRAAGSAIRFRLASTPCTENHPWSSSLGRRGKKKKTGISGCYHACFGGRERGMGQRGKQDNYSKNVPVRFEPGRAGGRSQSGEPPP